MSKQPPTVPGGTSFLFQSTRLNFSQHIKNLSEGGGIKFAATNKKILSVRKMVNRNGPHKLEFKNLDVIDWCDQTLIS